MLKLTSKQNCCGCTACASICPKGCIAMTPDSEGFCYPQIDEAKCINCGLCEKVCPLLHKPAQHEVLNVYGAKNSDDSVRFTSSSGFIFCLGILVRVMCAIRIASFGRDHQVKAGYGGNAGRRLDDLQPGTQGIRRGVASAGDKSVHVARFEHERAEKGRVLRLLSRLLFRHPLRLSQRIEKLRVFFRLRGSQGIDNLHAAEIDVGICLSDLRFVAEQDDARDALFHDVGSRLDDALVLAFAQHDLLVERGCLFFDDLYDGFLFFHDRLLGSPPFGRSESSFFEISEPDFSRLFPFL